MDDGKVLVLPALETRQGDRMVYSFSVDGKRLRDFSDVSRIHREDHEISGYQRPEVRSHVAGIKAYLESADPILPNSIVIAFDSSVSFVPTGVYGDHSVTGNIHIPITDPKPGWIVDGQQRAAAVRESSVSSFPVCVNAFIARDESDQREQFILVNSTKPLPRGLIYELLPGTDSALPTALRKKKLPAAILEELNTSYDSPFAGKIKTITNPDGTIKDNSVLRMIENSLSDGALYRFRDDSGWGDVEKMRKLLEEFWGVVACRFPEAWGLVPRKSRLVHGVGIVSLGFVMDAIDYKIQVSKSGSFYQEFAKISDLCKWTEGEWEFGRQWNKLQNTSSDIQLLTRFLVNAYRNACAE